MQVLKNFIVLEGLDGSGTTTQSELLAERFLRTGVACEVAFEPTPQPIGLLCRKVLKKELDLDPRALALLFAADRAQHLFDRREGLLQATAADRVVVCDRYLFSSLAYQSLDCGFEWVLGLNREFPLPEVLIFLDVPPAECNRRMRTREQVELFDNLELQEQILSLYRRGIASFSESEMRVGWVSGVGPREEVHERIWSFIGRGPIH